MRRGSLLLLLLLAGCSYDELHRRLRVSGTEDGTALAPDSGVHQADVWVQEATSTLRTDAVRWTYGGAFEPGARPGSFRVTGPGVGTIQAEFLAGETLQASLTVRAPKVAPTPPTPEPTATPAPAATPLPAMPRPAASPEADQLIQEAYRLADDRRYFDAVARIAPITDPDWQPKVRALEAEWGDRAVDQGFQRVRSELVLGHGEAARLLLDTIGQWPLRPTQRQTAKTLDQQVSRSLQATPTPKGD